MPANMTYSRAVSLAAVFVVFTGACSGNSDSSPGQPMTPAQPIELEDAAEPWAAAVCVGTARCNPYSDRDFVDECTKTYTEWFRYAVVPSYAESVAKGSMYYDAKKISKCFAAFSSTPCTHAGSFPECNAAIRGTIAVGQACDYTAECADDGWCDQSTACPGVCRALLDVGGECTADTQCKAGEYCNTSTSPSRCQAYAAEGDACGTGASSPCGPGLVCSSYLAAGVCKSWHTVAQGAVCDPAAGLFCEGGSACVIVGKSATGSLTQRCVAISASGGVCSIAGTSFPIRRDNCPDNETCPLLSSDQDAGRFTSNCVVAGTALLPIGESCASSARCVGTAYCSSSTNTCTPKGKPGDTCSDEGESCWTQVCKGGSCQLWSALCTQP